MFIGFALSIAVTTNVISANYLDVNFDLTTDIYKPYRKPNDEPFYTNKHSTPLAQIRIQEFLTFLQISQYLTALFPCIKKPPQKMDSMMI